jgi:hypothetical protein
LYDKLAQEQAEYDCLQSDDYALFTDIPIDPAILVEGQAFWVRRNLLSQIAIRGASEEPEEADQEMEGIEEGGGGEEAVGWFYARPHQDQWPQLILLQKMQISLV